MRPIQGSSPYKKPGPHGIIGTGSPSNTKLRTGPGTAEESARLQVSFFFKVFFCSLRNKSGINIFSPAFLQHRRIKSGNGKLRRFDERSQCHNSVRIRMLVHYGKISLTVFKILLLLL